MKLDDSGAPAARRQASRAPVANRSATGSLWAANDTVSRASLPFAPRVIRMIYENPFADLTGG